MKKLSITINMLIPILWIMLFFLSKHNVFKLDYGEIYLFLWCFLPIAMFIFNTLMESSLKKLAILYLISMLLQALGVFIDVYLHYNYISGDPGTHAVGMLVFIFTVALNFILSVIGLIIKGIIKKCRKNK